VTSKDGFDQSFDFVFLHAGPHGLHRFYVGFGRDVRRTLHDLDFSLAL
jgi:hypothetical protein